VPRAPRLNLSTIPAVFLTILDPKTSTCILVGDLNPNRELPTMVIGVSIGDFVIIYTKVDRLIKKYARAPEEVKVQQER
jgi:hypothetical protein